ncbi:MAG: hypothetical protein C0467_12310 [Planctomycetaceae bacterium]|nr:hypothetical protein [Planctomycetaceae bacterium]
MNQSFGLRFYDLKIDIVTDRPDLVVGLLERLPGCWQRCQPGAKRRFYLFQSEHGVSLARGKKSLESDVSDAFAVVRLERDLEILAALRNSEVVFVHAGAVGWNGKVILIPGRSYSGKSTLTAALCEAGATYYSDEYALIDVQGRVHPYPRPWQLRHENVKRFPVSPTRVATVPAPVGVVLRTRYREGERWQPRKLSLGESILTVLANTLPARDRPREVLATLSTALDTAIGFQSYRGDALETAQAILDLVSSHGQGESPSEVPATMT